MEPLLLCVADAEKRRGGGKKRRGVGEEAVASLTGTDGGGADGHHGCHCYCLRRCREERERKAQMRARVRASWPLAGFVPPKSKESPLIEVNGSDRMGSIRPRRVRAAAGFPGPGLGCGLGVGKCGCS
jgi:hypothetical protein